MAGEIQVNSVTALTESGSNIVLNNVDTATNRTNLGLGSIATQAADSVSISGGNITGGTIGSSVVFPTHHIIQIDSSQTQAAQTITSLTDITGLSASMTITSGNKVFISASVLYGGSYDNYGYINVCDGSNSVIYQSNWATGSQVNASMPTPVLGGSTRGPYHVHHVGFQYLWTPGVTSITVKLRAERNYGSGSLYINRPENNTNAAYIVGGTSSLTIMEVQA